ncbi:MAG: 30S ribosomal protein S2 [Candidatus Hydrogenedentes bacterium]|nr:30S ribosomal protein S2 [Candidatus Hydrogenedentota bacterium]
MPVVTMRQLLEAGIHFGHQTRRWNPKMARYIFGQRNGIYIIDLQKTLKQISKAHQFVRDSVAQGGSVLFVGTKKQAQEPIQREAARCGMYYMTNRWLGGTLTNFETVRTSIKNLVRLEELDTTGQLEKYSKKEAARLRREMGKLRKNLDGIKTMEGLPTVMFVIDAKKEAIAVREAERLGITCIGVVDTNADPDAVPIPVPGNDDAIRAIGLFCSIIADAAIEGKTQFEKVRSEQAPRGPRVRRIPAGSSAAADASAEPSVETAEEQSEAGEPVAVGVGDSEGEK